MIGVPLVLLFMNLPWRGIVIQYLVSEVSFTTWYLNLKATQTRYAVSRFSKLAEDETLVLELSKSAQLEILSDYLD